MLIDNIRIWDGRDRLIERGAIRIADGRIEEVLTADERSGASVPPGVPRIDGGGRLAIPGLTCAHTHLYSVLARGMSLSRFRPSSFTEILEQLWWRLDKALDDKSVRMSALVGAMEAARCGVTTLIDHHASPNAIDRSLDLLRDAVCGDVGLRASLCYELSDRDGEGARDRGIEENLRFLEEAEGGGMCAPLFGLHASFTLSDRSLQAVSERIPEGAGVHIHVAEGPEDEERCVAEHGCRVIDRLDRFGLLRPASILVHCLHCDEGEKDRIAERGSMVVHNPRSNMNNGVGVFDLAGFVDREVLVGLGTDGLGANLFGELFTAALLQKTTAGDPLAAPFPVLNDLLFRNNPLIGERLLGLRTGTIEPGAPADIAILDYNPPTPLGGENVLGHLLFGTAVHSLRVTDLFVAGRPVLREGRFEGLDEEKIYSDARAVARRLWERAENE